MRTAYWDSGDPEMYFDNPNLRWGSPSYLLEAGDPGYVPPLPTVNQTNQKKKRMKHNKFWPGPPGRPSHLAQNLQRRTGQRGHHARPHHRAGHRHCGRLFVAGLSAGIVAARRAPMGPKRHGRGGRRANRHRLRCDCAAGLDRAAPAHRRHAAIARLAHPHFRPRPNHQRQQQMHRRHRHDAGHRGRGGGRIRI